MGFGRSNNNNNAQYCMYDSEIFGTTWGRWLDETRESYYVNKTELWVFTCTLLLCSISHARRERESMLANLNCRIEALLHSCCLCENDNVIIIILVIILVITILAIVITCI